MNLPQSPTVPHRSPTTPSMSRTPRPENAFFPQFTQQQIEERMAKTRDVFAKLGQTRALPLQLAQAQGVFIATNSIYMNEAISVLPRVENDGNFQLPPLSNPEVRPCPLPQLNAKST